MFIFFAHPELYSSTTLPSQGVYHKLVSFETLLEKLPTWQGNVVRFQVVLQTTESNQVAAGGVTDVVSRFKTLTYYPVVFLSTQDFSLVSIWRC